jgi:hypothetical protein
MSFNRVFVIPDLTRARSEALALSSYINIFWTPAFAGVTGSRIPRSLERGMNDKSEKILIIGEAQRSRPDTPQLAAGRVHYSDFEFTNLR